jgi:hypothetical protein
MSKQGYEILTIKEVAIGNLLIDVYSNIPPSLADAVNGPQNSECARFHFDNLLTSKDVRDNWELLQKTAQKTFQQSIESCDWDLIFLEMGVVLHAVQDFYSHSNWVEEWDRNGYEVSKIPTWNESEALIRTNPNGRVAKDARRIQNLMHTGEFGTNRQKVKKSVETHDDLNKDSPNSKRGMVQSQFTKMMSYHNLARTLGERATDEWGKKIEDWIKVVNCNWSGNSFKSGKRLKRKIVDENQELRNLFISAGRWEENKDQEGVKIISSYIKWKNRFSEELKKIVSKDFRDFQDKNPMNKYL